MNQVFLTDVINWVGVAVGVLGAIVVAPSGFSEFARKIVTGARRFLPSKPKNVTVSAGTASAFAAAMQGYAHVGMPTGLGDHELLQYLVQRLDELSKTLLDVQKQADDRHRQIKREISRIESSGKRSESEILRMISDSERQSAQFNARGLPLIAAGTVMTGPASILAECVPFGWVCVAGGIGLVIYGVWPWRDRFLRRSKRDRRGAHLGRIRHACITREKRARRYT
jgi:hypothetical protein